MAFDYGGHVGQATVANLDRFSIKDFPQFGALREVPVDESQELPANIGCHALTVWGLNHVTFCARDLRFGCGSFQLSVYLVSFVYPLAFSALS